MKKLILSIVAAIAVTASMAQAEGTSSEANKERKHMDPSEMVEKRTQEMVTKYGLSDEQATKLKSLNEKYMPKKGDGPMGPPPEKPSDNSSEDRSANVRPAGPPPGGHHGGPDMTAYNKELKAILTDAQYKAYETDMENFKKNHKK